MGLVQVVENETFDTMSHRKFLWKIKNVEINLERKEYMDTATTVIRVERKILQGSYLRPVLFNILIITLRARCSLMKSV